MKEIAVKVYDNDIEKAMRILKKKIQNDGLFKRLKLKKSYEKPSEFRRRKQREARKYFRLHLLLSLAEAQRSQRYAERKIESFKNKIILLMTIINSYKYYLQVIKK